MQNANALIMPGQGLDGQAYTMRAAHQQPGTRTGYLGIADSLRIIRRRRWLILLVVAAVVLLTMLYLSQTQPIYSSTTTVMVPPPDQNVQSAPGAPTLAPSPNEETAIQTRVELLQSRSLARQTAESLQLSHDPEFAPGPGGPGFLDSFLSFLQPGVNVALSPSQKALAAERARSEAVTDHLMGHLNVARDGRSNVISITASSADPVKAARIANRLVDTYIRGQIDDANETRSQEIKALSERVKEVRGYLQNADMAAASYRKQHGLMNSRPEDSGSLQATQIAGLLAQAQADTASDARKAAPTVMPEGGVSASSALLTDLRGQEALLTRKLGELTSFYGPGYPDVAKTQAELTALRARIDQETARLTADLNSQASASQARSGSLSAAIAGLRSRSFNDDTTAVPLRALERNSDAVNTLYTTLLNQLNAKIGQTPDLDPDITRISRAPVPDEPSYPLPKRVLAVAFVGALALGTLLAFVIEAMDTKLRTSEQVQRLLGIPTLAMIPEMEDDEGPVHSIVAGRPRSRFAEAMRNLLIELETRIEKEGPKIVVVTSPLEDEGKNTIAASLGAAAAVIGRHAVVVDFDLRRPESAGSNTLPVPNGAGVVAYLADRAHVDELAIAEDEQHFAVIGVGESAADPGALIASPRLPELLDQLRQRFELVILNAPPILPVRDAKTLADHADATLLVLRWGRTSPEAAAAAMDIFDRPVTGAVLNRVDYEVHANRRYGDAIHHVAQSMAYYDPEPDQGRWGWLRRTRRRFRRGISRTAEALHLA
ncbi:GumC family protein [Sphingomonas sp. PR090111-T3T-6A]|uniref:GumC family protein n=1 Tax=Sphingomonas sp. PR090111-T3T-6A TaxID=685778 RepID=UPI0003697AA4|nr:Wzz/FepE/Etk N-terminal domain-containing protein [Sphingomonas sp. PR090111-T3T-6A]